MFNGGYENEHSKKSMPAEPSVEIPTKTAKNSVRKLLKQFASDTSFGGVSKVTLSEGHLRRFLWTIISATCYGFTIYMCYRLIVQYLDKPISTTVDIVYEKNIHFPSVTICNLNQFRKSSVIKVDGIEDVLQSFGNKTKRKSSSVDKKYNSQINSLRKDASLNSDIDEDDEFDNIEIEDGYILKQLVAIAAADYPEEELKEVGHQFDEMLISCTWMGLSCKNGSLAKFWTGSWNWKYGNCFTFNPGADENGKALQILRTSMPGPNFGLSMNFDIQQKEYINELVDEAGLKIVIHNARQMPFPYDEGITVPPGFSSSIAIRQETIKRVDPFSNNSCNPQTNIGSNNLYKRYHGGGGIRYSVKVCMLSCLAIEQNRTCNCSGTQFSNLGVKICEDDELSCLANVNSDYKNGRIGCSRGCPQPCLHQSFRHSVMMSALTTNAKENAKKDFGENDTDDDIADNFLRVNVFYEELNLQKIVQSTNYGLENLLGDIGGQLGLWIGISVISVAEFGELLISLFVVLVRKSRDKKKTTSSEVMEMK